MFTVPKQVDEAVDLAEKLHGEMFNTSDQEEDQQTEETTKEPAAEETPEEPVEETKEEPTSDKKEDEETYKARYLSLKGMYDKEVPLLHRELKELKAQVFERLGEIGKPKEEPKPDANAEKLEKFRAEYGDELLEMARLVARTELEPLISQKIDPVQQKVDSVEKTQVSADQQKFLLELDGKVEGDWREVWLNDDPKFNAFLASKEPYGLFTFEELLTRYSDAFDSDGVAAIFNAYIQTAKPAPKVEQKVEPKVEYKPNPAKEAIVAPSRTQAVATPQSQDKRIWTREMMQEFERNDRMGRYSAEESAALWQDLLSAPNENRIR